MQTTTPQPVEFSLHAPNAHEVFLSGSFNDWSADTLPLLKTAEGHWSAVVQLPPGHYDFKYIIDGKSEEIQASHTDIPSHRYSKAL